MHVYYMCVCAPLYMHCVCNKCSTHTAHTIYIYYIITVIIAIIIVILLLSCLYHILMYACMQYTFYVQYKYACIYNHNYIYYNIYIYTSSLYCYVFTSCPLLGFTEHFRSSKRNLVAPLSEHLSCSIGIETAAKALVRSVSKHHLMWHVWL